MLSDTHPDVEKIHAELLRKAAPEKRLAMALSLTATVVNLSRQTLDMQYPDLSPEDRNLKWIELHYGRKLAMQIRNYREENC